MLLVLPYLVVHPGCTGSSDAHHILIERSFPSHTSVLLHVLLCARQRILNNGGRGRNVMRGCVLKGDRSYHQTVINITTCTAMRWADASTSNTTTFIHTPAPLTQSVQQSHEGNSAVIRYSISSSSRTFPRQSLVLLYKG